MVVMTAKVSKSKRIALLIVIAALVVLAIVGLSSGSDSEAGQTEPTISVADNDGRLAFLSSFGWTVSGEPVQTQQVKIPDQGSEVFDRYNELQISQGYDLNSYAGKTVTRYVYEIQNYENAAGPVYASLLVYQDQVVGGDVASDEANGIMHGFAKPS